MVAIRIVVAVRPRVDPTAPLKIYMPKRGGRSHKPPLRELDMFVVDINASSNFSDALQIEGCTVHFVTHPDVAYSKNCAYVAGIALNFFFHTLVQDWDDNITEPTATFKISPEPCRILAAAALAWLKSCA